MEDRRNADFPPPPPFALEGDRDVEYGTAAVDDVVAVVAVLVVVNDNRRFRKVCAFSSLSAPPLPPPLL